MNFCQSCALRLTQAVTQHADLSLIDSDLVDRRRRHRKNVDRQRCYAALTQGYLEVSLSVDPEEAVAKRPGTKLLFVLDGHGPRRQRDIHHLLHASKETAYGNNFFKLTREVVDWLSDEQETVLDLRTIEQRNAVRAA